MITHAHEAGRAILESEYLIRGYIRASKAKVPVTLHQSDLENKLHSPYAKNTKSAKDAKIDALGGSARYRDPSVRCLNHPPSPPFRRFVPSSLPNKSRKLLVAGGLVPQPIRSVVFLSLNYNRDNSTPSRHIPHGQSRVCQSTDMVMPPQHGRSALPGGRYHCFSAHYDDSHLLFRRQPSLLMTPAHRVRATQVSGLAAELRVLGVLSAHQIREKSNREGVLHVGDDSPVKSYTFAANACPAVRWAN
ncbi:MAG: hypothetical protein HETSPECPRED_006548 [Heterodermia speciosa]|uniref:Uncharacterized protein n=1 Tax=Heterodermia speciosa TaxID=116794 RepID=A0A8H3FT18_9LECA|nr:MAG: hypothetical protein HETSPECPRED_006548 [Heterodermia speciosa]